MKQQRKNRNYWTKKNCKTEALKYKSRSFFKKQSPGAFGNAYKNKWLDEICFHMKNIGNRFSRLVYVYKFSDNNVYVGLTYDIDERDDKHKRDYRSIVCKHIKKTGLIPKLTYSNYMIVNKAIILEKDTVEQYRKNGYNILNTAKTGAIGGGNLKWTFEKCFEEAVKFKTRNEFSTNSNSAYNSARRYGWLEKICVHMNIIKRKSIGYWTKEKCTEEALKYLSKKELHEKSSGAYMAMLRNGWLYELCPHMKTKKSNGYWTKEKCIDEALKYSSKKEFGIKNNSAYVTAIKKGWIDEMFNRKLQ